MTFTYKIGHTQENNELKKIYVFYGFSKTDLDSLFIKESTNPIFLEIFSPAELQIIREKDIPVTFLPVAIYPDDTIETIKEKIIQSCGLNCAFSEMYLFAQQKERLNALTIFQTLTQNEKLDLTRERLVQFLLNISDESAVAEQESSSFLDQLVDKPL